MGWSFSFDKDELINPETGRIDVCNYFDKNMWSSNYEVVGKSSFVNNYELYTLLRDKETKQSIICVSLVSLCKDKWGYKGMDETMEPYYYNCPQKILKLAEESEPISDNAKHWRDKCWETIKRKKEVKAIKVGTILTFKKPFSFTNGVSADTFILSESIDLHNRKKTYFRLFSKSESKVKSEVRYNIKGWKKMDFTIL